MGVRSNYGVAIPGNGEIEEFDREAKLEAQERGREILND